MTWGALRGFPLEGYLKYALMTAPRVAPIVETMTPRKLKIPSQILGFTFLSSIWVSSLLIRFSWSEW